MKWNRCDDSTSAQALTHQKRPCSLSQTREQRSTFHLMSQRTRAIPTSSPLPLQQRHCHDNCASLGSLPSPWRWPSDSGKDWVSDDQLPPTSMARSRRRARPDTPTSSRQVASFLRRAAASATPLVCAAPPNNGKPPTTTSNLRAMAALGTARSRSRTMVTLLPASRQVRAAALSKAHDVLPSTVQAQAAQWWPLASNGRPHRQLRKIKLRGNWRRRRRSTRNKWGSNCVTRHVGHVDNARPAPEPAWDLAKRSPVLELPVHLGTGLVLPTSVMHRTEQGGQDIPRTPPQ